MLKTCTQLLWILLLTLLPNAALAGICESADSQVCLFIQSLDRQGLTTDQARLELPSRDKSCYISLGSRGGSTAVESIFAHVRVTSPDGSYELSFDLKPKKAYRWNSAKDRKRAEMELSKKLQALRELGFCE